MWCELVLNGIGGRTISEAQERLSFLEFQQWIQYRQKYGSLNPMMRTEWGAALISSVLANV
ncbi:phage tail protein, partial [Citrobacter freundii]